MCANLGRPATLRTLVKTSRRTRLLMLACVLLTAALTTHAQTKMFKCIIDARTVYQQTGCPVGSLADDVKPTAGTAAASRPAASGPSMRGGARAATPPASAGGNPENLAKTADARRGN